jgi:hypothetical protein
MTSRWISVVPICFLLIPQIILGFDFAAGKPLLTQCAGVQSGIPTGICLMVKDTVYSWLREKLQRWRTDKENLGANVLLKVISTESPSTIRSFLKNATSLAGCLMVGDIPYVEYEWSYPDVYGKQLYDRFPTDLYYMDLDGDWMDSDGNGAYDKISGDLGPEIWVGRLKASNLSENEIDLLQRYFDKNHEYLTGTLVMPSRALLYVDEITPDAEDSVTRYYKGELATRTAEGLSRIYSDVVSVLSPKYTNSSDYLARLREPWSLLRLFVHGWESGHSFYSAGQTDKVSSMTVKITDPKCLFYLITSCHNFDYRKRDYMAAWYIFSSYGLLAIGDSSIRDFLTVLPETFFSALRTEGFGGAYVAWARECVKKPGMEMHPINFVLIGDPSLGTDRTQRIPEFQTAMPVATSIMALVLITARICRTRNKRKINLMKTLGP